MAREQARENPIERLAQPLCPVRAASPRLRGRLRSASASTGVEHAEPHAPVQQVAITLQHIGAVGGAARVDRVGEIQRPMTAKQPQRRDRDLFHVLRPLWGLATSLGNVYIGAMALLRRMRMIGLFAVMCLIWGATWLAMKLGVASVPPVFFGGTRFVAAGLVLLLLAWLRGEIRRLDRHELGRLVLVQVLMVVLTYGPLFWGIRYVPSGPDRRAGPGPDAGVPARVRHRPGRGTLEPWPRRGARLWFCRSCRAVRPASRGADRPVRPPRGRRRSCSAPSSTASARSLPGR